MPASSPHALVLIGHGSTLNPDSSTPTLTHAAEIRRRGGFAEVVCAFWKEEPSLREVLRMVDSPEVFVVPNFISEGYFTTQVIPRELGLTGPSTPLPAFSPGGPERRIHYCDPVGLHPSMTRLLLARAEAVAPGLPRDQCALIIVGHGTGLNDNSTKAIKDQVTLIRESGAGFAEVTDAYMEQAPLVAEWDQLTRAPHVIVVPFFIADGLHSFQDIPVLLGIEEEITAAASQMSVFKQNPHNLRGRQLYYSSAIGTEPQLADVVLDQVEAFRLSHPDLFSGTPVPPPDDRKTLTGFLTDWLAGGGNRIGEVIVQSGNGAWRLRHYADSAAPECSLTTHRDPADALDIARLDAAGAFRPLKSAPTLRRGWELILTTPADLLTALDALYPAAVANLMRHAAMPLPRGTLHGMLARQTGMYRVTGLLQEEEAQSLVAETCHDGKCLRRLHWDWDGGTPWHQLPAGKTVWASTLDAAAPELPLLCTDACPLLIGAARDVVKSRLKANTPTPAPAAVDPS